MGVEPWGLYPPEINAGRYITGIGAPTFLASLIEWTGLAAMVAEANLAFAGQVGALTGNWMGVASGGFGAAAPPFAAWLANMQQVSLTNAGTALSVLRSYATGMATMIPLPLIIANRVAARTAQVVSVLGAPNTEAIRLELEYAMYWAQNGAVMSIYDVEVNTATMPKPVPPPPPLVLGTGGVAATGAAESALMQQMNGASTAMRGVQSGLHAGTGMVSQAMSPSLMGPNVGDTGIWSDLLGGGVGASDGGLGSFAAASSPLGGGGGGGGGGLGGGVGMVPTAAPLTSMAKPGPIAAAAPLEFGGVQNSPTVTRPATPMMPPMHPNAAGKRGNSASAAPPSIIAAEQEFAAAFGERPASDDEGTTSAPESAETVPKSA